MKINPELKKQIKAKKKEIDQEKDKKIADQEKEIDKKFDNFSSKMEDFKAREKAKSPLQLRKLENKSAWSWFTDGAIWRGFLWLVQVIIFIAPSYATAQAIASSVLPEIGNAIGHSVGLTTSSKMIDVVNLMFIPTAFMGLFYLAMLLTIMYWFWRLLNKLFGKWRLHSMQNHNLL